MIHANNNYSHSMAAILYPEPTRVVSALPSGTKTLAALRHGETAAVVDIDGAQPALIARLAARGLVPGATLTVLRGGDPLLILVDDSRWALTRADAEHIYVEAAPTSLRRRLLSYLLP
jgi:Fe2+ transport system protein FeoA